MRTRLLAPLLITFALMFVGCSPQSGISSTQEKEETLHITGQESPVPSNIPEIETSSPLFFWGQTNGTLGAGCGTDSGYYYWCETDSTHANLWYADYNEQATTPLCSRPDCLHVDETCTSWLGWRGGYPQIATNGENLILVYSNTSAAYFEQYQDAALANIQVMNLDGSEKNSILTLPTNQDIQLGVACDESHVYVITATENQASTIEMELCSISSEDGTLRSLYSLPKGSSFIAGVSGRMIIIKTFTEPDGGSLYSDDDQQIISCVDVDTGECVHQEKLPFGIDAMALQTLIESNKLFVFSPKDNCIYTKDLITGDELENFDGVIKDTIQYGQLVRAFGSKVIFSETYTSSETQEPSYFWIDIENGNRGQLALKGSYGTTARGNFTIVPICQIRGNFLTVSQCSSKTITYFDGKGHTIEAVTVVPQYAFISTQNYWSNVPNFDQLEDISS